MLFRSPDEVYVYRPGGTPTTNGTINSATFSDLLGRTAFDDSTNPYAFLQDGSPAGIFISNIRYYTDSMTFKVDLDMPRNLSISRIDDAGLSLSWSGSTTKTFMVAASLTDEILSPGASPSYSPGDNIGANGSIVYKGTGTSFTHSGLQSDERYYYTIWLIINESSGVYSTPLRGSETTGIHYINQLPWMEDFSSSTNNELPRGWKAEGGINQWALSSGYSYSNPNSILIRNLGYKSEWFYTPGVALASQSRYLITFRYRSNNPAVRETISLNGGTDRHNNGLLQHNIYNDSYVQYNDYVIARSVFTPSENGVHYFGLKTQPFGQGVVVDDFRIERVPSGTTNLSDPSAFYPNPTTGIITVPVKERTEITILLPGGVPVFRKIIEGTTDIDLSHLKTGIYIIRFSSKTSTTSSRLIIVSQLP